MNIDHLLTQQGVWLQGEGPHSDIVISSRIRLARNLEGYPFVNRATENDLNDVLSTFQNNAQKLFDNESIFWLDLRELAERDRYFLLERQLISKELIDSTFPRGVLIDRKEEFSVMVNEEDHLRIQSLTGGFDLKKVWKRICEIDDLLESQLQIAFDEKKGYLTACPSNVGTGIRVSVMLHLPGLVQTGELERVFRSFQKLSLAVRGLYGEGSSALGEFFQLSNQVTLGKTEEELIEQVADVVPLVLAYEEKARNHLLTTDREKLLDRCFRALGVLKTARTITIEEAMELLSRVRLGRTLQLMDGEPSVELLNELLLQLQPAHLEKLAQRTGHDGDLDVFRAGYIREKIK